MRQRAAGKDARLPFPSRTRTRADSQVAHDSDDAAAGSPSNFGSEEQFEALRELFPELFPQSPSIENRQSFRAMENPFLENQAAVTERYSCPRRARRLDTGVVNGYLKFVVRSKDHNDSGDIPHGAMSMPNDTAVHHRNVYVPNFRPEDNVARLPQGFGSNAKIDATDRKILRFCMYFDLSLNFFFYKILIAETRYIRSLWRPHFATENECLARSWQCY